MLRASSMTERVHQLGVAVAGAGHSGSTLLGLVLGSHSSAFYAGEAKKTIYIGDVKKPLRKRVCKICGPECVVWSRFEVPPEPDLYEHLARLTERSVIIDSTKRPAWIQERRAELDAVGVPHRIIFLTRDGRAVVNSRVRKYPERPPAEVVDHWLGQIGAARELVEERPEHALEIRYEDLATRPEETVRRVCAFLELPFEAPMLDYEKQTHHPLGGNTGTQSLVARAASIDSELAKVPKRSADYYGPMRGGFSIDLRWREELPAEVLRVFEERVGDLNDRYRWEDSES